MELLALDDPPGELPLSKQADIGSGRNARLHSLLGKKHSEHHEFWGFIFI